MPNTERRSSKKSKAGMSLRQYARSRHFSPSSVHLAIQTGRITRNADGTLDAERADREWGENTRERPTNGHAGGPSGSFMAARTRRETAQAGLSELELAAKSGELITVDIAAEMWESAVLRMKSAMLTSISRTAPRLVGLRSVAQAHAALESIVHDALSALASVADEIEQADKGPS